MATVVIGGGLAGLTAANLLSRAGERVTLFEKARDPGGRARTDVVGEFRFDLGPHALYLGGEAMRTFRELGIEVHGRVPKLGYRGIFEGKLHAFPFDAKTLLTTRLLPFAAKIEAAKLLSGLPETRGGETVFAWLDRVAKHRATRAYLGALVRVTTYSNDGRVDAAAVRAQLARAQAGVWYLDGGWGTLVAALREAAVATGATVETGARVESIEIEGGRARAVRLAGGRRVEADAVVVATEPEHAGALLGRRFDVAPIRAACLGLALKKLPDPKTMFALGVDLPTYFSVHSTTVKVAPEGTVLAHAAKYLPPDDDGSTAEAEIESMLDLVQPGWRAEVIHRRWLPKMTVVHALPGQRPPVAVDGLANVAIAGDWVGDEAMLSDTAVASARRAAGAILAARAKAAA